MSDDAIAWCLMTSENQIINGVHEDRRLAEQYRHRYPSGTLTPLYTHPANVAALESRVRELEEENARLKNNPLESDVTCALMDSQYVAGAKFGWNCGQDEDHESLTKMIEGRLSDRIKAGVSFSTRSQDARAALKREGAPS